MNNWKSCHLTLRLSGLMMQVSIAVPNSSGGTCSVMFFEHLENSFLSSVGIAGFGFPVPILNLLFCL